MRTGSLRASPAHRIVYSISPAWQALLVTLCQDDWM
jgi:hypothetical protein